MDCERMGRRTGGESARSIRDPYYFSLSCWFNGRGREGKKRMKRENRGEKNLVP
jgi:hypothetical protein